MIKRSNPLLTPTLLATILLLFLSACQGAVGSDQAEESPIEPTTAVPAPTNEPDPPAKPTQAEPVEAKPAEAKPQAEPVETEPAKAEPKQAESVEVEAVEESTERTWTTEDINLTMADGLEIAGMLTLPESGDPVPAVLLLHMLGSNQQAWSESDLLTMLNDQGYATFTVDMRGHGATGGANDWDLAETDLQLVWQFMKDLPEVDGQATAVIGASIGANMALRLAANVPQIDTAVLLSPGLDYRGVTTDDALANYGERPILYVAAEGDKYANDSAKVLYGQTRGHKQAERLEGSAHGTQMLTAEPSLSEIIAIWLDEQVQTGDPDVPTTDAGQVVSIERADLIELAGTLYGSGTQAVVFANMNDNNAEPWTETAVMLADAGYMALTFDYRSGGRAFMDERDDDLIAAAQYALDQGAEEIIVVGASIGGPAILKGVSAHSDLPVAGMIIIAAPDDLGGEDITAEEFAAIQIPQLYMTAEDDHLGLDAAVERLFEMASEPKAWQTVPGTAHGSEIFAAAEGPLLQAAIIEFITENMPH